MRRLLLVLLFLTLLTTPAFAVDVDSELFEASGAQALQEALPSSAMDILGQLELEDSLDLDTGLSQIIDYGSGQLAGYIRGGLKRAALLLGVVLLCALVRNLRDASGDSSQPVYVSFAAVLAVTALGIGSLRSFVGLGSDAIADLSAFSKALLPTLAAALAASGRSITATGMYAAASLFCDILITLIDRVILPFVYLYVGASAAEAALSGVMMGRIAALIKWLVTNMLKFLLLGFTAYLSISGVISGSADSAAVKAAKTALSAAVPLVGSIISDASEAVLVSASILKSSAGIFGLLAVLAVCVSPFLNIGVNYLAYKGCAALASAIGGGNETKLIDDLGTALGMVLAMAASCALVLLISCTAALKAVVG